MSLDAQKRAAAVTNSMPLVDSPADSNRKAFLDLAGLQLESTESLSDQMRSLPPIAALKQAVIDVKSIHDIFKPYLTAEALARVASDPSGAIPVRIVGTILRPSPPSSQITLYVSLRHLVCVDETGDGWLGELG